MRKALMRYNMASDDPQSSEIFPRGDGPIEHANPEGQTDAAAGTSAASDVHEAGIGTCLDEKLVYKAKSTYCSCCDVWEDDRPKDEHGAERNQQAEKARSKYAIIKRQDRHGLGVWKTDSIVINSKILRSHLANIFRDYPGVDAHALVLKFKSPFIPFVHRWLLLEQALESETDDTGKRHLALLIEILGPDTEDSFRRLKNLEDTGFVTFSDLTLAFICGETILHSEGCVLSAGRLNEVSIGKGQDITFCAFDVDVVDWNGSQFGIKNTQWALLEYTGSRRLSELQVHPFRVDTNQTATKDFLIARGRMFESLQGQHFRKYVGNALVENRQTYESVCRKSVPVRLV